MRRHGCIDSPEGLGVCDHVCWAYESDDELREVALEWLDDGWWLSQRMVYTADKPRAELMADIAPIGDVEDMIATGQLIVAPTSELYDVSTPLDAQRQLAVYAAAVDDARAAGFDGMRVVADITSLITDPSRRPAHVRWEHAADRWMSQGNPLAALCAYDRRIVDGPDVHDICAVHPLVNHNGVNVPFHLYGAGETLALDGEVDAFGAQRLERLLAAAVPADGALVDLGEIDFIDHNAALALARHARDTGSAIAGAPSHLRRVWDVLEIESRYGVACA